VLQFQVLIEEPIILIPKSSTSEDVVETNLGRISIENQFQVQGKDRTSGDISESIQLAISDIRLACGKYLGKNVMQGSETILQRTDMQLAIGRSINPSTSDIKVDLKVPRVGVILREDQLELLVGIYTENLNEGAPSTSVPTPPTQLEATPTQAATSSTALKMDLSFVLSEVSFELYGYDTQGTIVPTVAVYLETLESNLKQFSDSSMKVYKGNIDR
jgi:hypothetical protein